jgi:ribosomal-protein-alanine N-acetyltransferase
VEARTIIETPRLLLREIIAIDAPIMFEMNNDPEVMRYTGDIPFESLQHTTAFIEEYPNYKTDGYGRWAVVLKETYEVIGWCGLKNHPGEYVDLGYRLVQKHWNKGYATEASLASIAYGFEVLKLDEIVGRTAAANQASIRVFEKVGMQFWKKAECEGIVDSVFYKPEFDYSL